MKAVEILHLMWTRIHTQTHTQTHTHTHTHTRCLGVKEGGQF